MKRLFAHFERRSAEKQQAREFETQAANRKPRDEARAEQLATLKAAVPAGIPEKMRATIQLNKFNVGRVEQRRTRRHFAEDTWTSVEVGEDTRYSVDMILQISEIERSIISQHNLQHHLIEDEPFFTSENLRSIERQDNLEIEAIKDPLLQEVTRTSKEFARDLLKDDRRKTYLGDYLICPFTRTFDTAHEAKLYADKLKTAILPQIKELIETYREHKQSETVEF